MDEVYSTYVVVLASPEMQAEELALLARYGQDYPVISVDGGYDWCKQAGVSVDYAVGDFDSLGYIPEVSDVSVLPCEKDETDCEVALDYACSLGAKRLYVFAAFGGRLDHELSVVQQISRVAERGIEVAVLGNGFAMRTMVGPAAIDLPVLPQGTVSLLSASEECSGICIEGLKYSLHHATLTNRMSLCLSNEFAGKTASISLDSGTLLAIAPIECFF